MKIKLLYILLITLLLSNLFMVFMLVKKPYMPDLHRPNEFLLRELNLTDSQLVIFKEVSQKHKMNLRDIENSIRDSKDLLFSSYGKKTAAYVDSLTNQIGLLETKKHKEIVSFFGEVKNVCDKEQAKKFNKLIERGLNKKGRPMR